MNVKQQNPSTSQRCRDYAWRRLNIRRSAARRPNKFQYRFQTRVAIAVDIVYRSSQYRWLQVVPRCADLRC